MAKFKVGDRIRVVDDDTCPERNGLTGVVEHVNDDMFTKHPIEVRLETGGVCSAASCELEHVSVLKVFDEYGKVNKGGFMGNIVSKVKNLTVSKDDKLLRKHNVVTECGDLTDEGKDLVLQVLFEQNKKQVVEQVELVDKEEKAEKKK